MPPAPDDAGRRRHSIRHLFVRREPDTPAEGRQHPLLISTHPWEPQASRQPFGRRRREAHDDRHAGVR